MIIRNRRVRRKLKWVLMSLIVCAPATATGEAQLRDRPKREAWRYQAKRSWKYQAKRSWKYRPKRTWKYQPKRAWKYHRKRSWNLRPRRAQESVSSPDLQKGAYRITCTHPLIAELVQQLTGARATVEAAAPDLGKLHSGFVPHSLRADIIFHNGLDSEGRPEEALQKFSRTKPVYAATKAMGHEQLIELAGTEGRHDPHVWLDISGWRKFAELVVRTVSEFDSANAGYYLANLERYGAQIDQLQAYAERVLATVPQESRVLISDNPALGYLVRPYGFEVRAILDLQREFRTTDRIIRFLADRNIATIFSDKPGSSRWVSALIERAETIGHELALGESLLSDVGGATGGYEGTYIGMMDYNITTIARALGGSAPEAGMQGLLQPSATRAGVIEATGSTQATPIY